MRYLENLGINRTDAATYASLMADKGIDTANDLLDMTPGQMEAYGMRSVHKQKLKNAIQGVLNRRKYDANEDGELPKPHEMWAQMQELTYEQGSAVFADLSTNTRKDMYRAVRNADELVDQYREAARMQPPGSL